MIINNFSAVFLLIFFQSVLSIALFFYFFKEVKKTKDAISLFMKYLKKLDKKLEGNVSKEI